MNQYFDKILENEQICFNHFDALLKDSPIYKNTGWKDEKEVRVFFRNFVDKGEFNKVLPNVQFLGKECKLNYCFKSGKPVFHYEVPLDLNLIKEFIIGPDNDVSINDLISLLSRANETLNLDGIKISKSKFTI